MAEFAPRQLWLLALSVTGAIGALTRFSNWFPDWFARYGGDTVWAAAWMFAWLSVFPRHRIRTASLLALTICSAIEIFQLTGVPATLAARGFLFRLLLGTTFGAWDLAAYAAGVLVGTAAALSIAAISCPNDGLRSD